MHSMTGYGRMSLERDGRQITVEMRSVNNRFLDLSFRMPRSFNCLEDAMRAQIGAWGYRVIELEMSEFRKIDGSITCLSLRW